MWLSKVAEGQKFGIRRHTRIVCVHPSLITKERNARLANAQSDEEKQGVNILVASSVCIKVGLNLARFDAMITIDTD